MNDVHRVIIINEKTTVIETPCPETCASNPGTAWRGRGVDERVPEIDATDPVPRLVAFAVAHRGRPGAFSVGLRVGEQGVVVSEIKGGDGVADVFPVLEILGAEDWGTRGEVEV